MVSASKICGAAFIVIVPLVAAAWLPMIEAYQAGIPANGKPVPDGAKMAKVHWAPKQNQFFKDATVSGELVNVDFMVKDSKRFADSGGWARDYVFTEYGKR